MHRVALTVIVVIGIALIFFLIQSQPSKTAQQSEQEKVLGLITSPSPTGQLQPIQTTPEASPLPTVDPILKAVTKATIHTQKGDIILQLYTQDAPHTVANFANKSKSGFYNGLTFHRVEDWVIQGGDPKGDGTGGGNMPVEFNNKPFVKGSLGVASRGDGQVQNDSQFFITKSDASWLNGQYTNFGIVIEGMDIVDQIQIGDNIESIDVE